MSAHIQPISKKEFTTQVKGYLLGFSLCITLTLLAFLLVQGQVYGSISRLPYGFTLFSLAVFALLQFVVQVYFFLHLGGGSKHRSRQFVFWFMLLVVAILILGSIWIMQNLNYNMMHMSPGESNDYMQKHQGF